MRFIASLPDLPQHHRRRRPPDAGDDRRSAFPLAVREVPTGTPGVRLDGAAGVEHPRRLDQGPLRPQRSSISRSRNLHVVNYSVPVHEQHVAGGAAAAPAHPARPAGLDPLPHLLLQGDLGLLPAPTASSGAAAGGRVRGLHRLDAGGRRLTYGECLLPGDREREVLLSCHVCHPSLCNDNLSGIAVDDLARPRAPARPRRRYSYRFLFIPGTIGSITWLARNEDARCASHGLVVAYLGDRGSSTTRRAAEGMRRSIAPWPRCCKHPASRSASRISSPSATTSGSTARPASICAVGSPDAHALRAVSRVPHLGGRPRFREARGAGGLAPHLPRGGRRARREPRAT